MLYPCHLEVVTTVAYHPAGREYHLRNLSWALRKIPHSITVMTFEDYKFESLFGETYLTVPRTHWKFYDFHHEFTRETIKSKRATHYLFTQQDILFHKQASYPGDKIHTVLPLYDHPFAVYKRNGSRLYPRVWEGGFFIPYSFLANAVRDGVKFGYQYSWTKRNLHRRFFVTAGLKDRGKIIPIRDWFNTPVVQKAEIMSDFTVYSAYWEFPYGPPSDIAIHASGPEHAHRLVPESYSNPEVLLGVVRGEYKRPYPTSAPNIALLYLLAGILQPGDLAATLLTSMRPSYHHNVFLDYVRKLKNTATEWMLPREYEVFTWACSTLPELETK